MLKGFAFVALLFAPVLGFSQDVEQEAPKRSNNIVKPARDFVMLQFTYEGWNNKPDSVHTTGIGRGFNAYICYDFPFKTSNFSFAAGVGIGTSNTKGLSGYYFISNEDEQQETARNLRSRGTKILKRANIISSLPSIGQGKIKF